MNLTFTSLSSCNILASSLPPFPFDYEKELFFQYIEENNEEALQKLVLHHLRFITYYVRKCHSYKFSAIDLIQEGVIGFLKSIKSYDPEKGFRLSTYSKSWIKAEINEFILKNSKIVKIATTKPERKVFFNLKKIRKDLNPLNPDEIDSLAIELNVPRKAVEKMNTVMHANDCQAEDLDYIFRGNDHETIETILGRQEALGLLANTLNVLDDRSSDIIKSRWLKEDRDTLKSLGNKYSVSQERIRQIEILALNKMKQSLNNRGVYEL